MYACYWALLPNLNEKKVYLYSRLNKVYEKNKINKSRISSGISKISKLKTTSRSLLQSLMFDYDLHDFT